MRFSVFGLVHRILCDFFFLPEYQKYEFTPSKGRINSAPGIRLDEKSDMLDRIELQVWG